MLSTQFKYNPSAINSKKKRIGSEEVVTSSLRIIFPERYMDSPLAMMGETVYIVGFFMVVDDNNNFAVSSIPAMIRTEPDRITKTTIDDVPYTTLHFDVGSRIVANTDVIIDDNLVHRVYSELLALGRIPFYYSYESATKFFLETKKYNGYELGSNPVLWEYIIATMARDPEDAARLYKSNPAVGSGGNVAPPAYVGLNDVSMGATDVINRQGGSYAKEGLTASLVDPSTRSERMESILRLN